MTIMSEGGGLCFIANSQSNLANKTWTRGSNFITFKSSHLPQGNCLHGPNLYYSYTLLILKGRIQPTSVLNA